ncbi:MAG: ABC transporter ATP-binding protein [Peptoniphilus sp.]|nr:ABC transporter ATP-binding protein [Peptoniphilus sp.]MDD7362873.1 ABC transporter ATP-binding protein [Bacillota bacterium]MDY6044886.1 ABC transporter ATP-binding protein [Peptoniphilus sp.]
MPRMKTVVQERDRRSLRSKESRRIVKRLFEYLNQDKMPMFFVVFFTAAATILDILTPWILGLGITSLYDTLKAGLGVDYDYLKKIIAILIALYAISSIFYFARGRLLVTITQKMIYTLRKELSEKIRRLPLSYLDQFSVGDLLSRMTNDMESIVSNMRQNIAQIISAVVTIVGTLAMMIYIDPRLTVISLIVLPISGLVTAKIASIGQHFFRLKSHHLGRINGYMEEIVSSQEVVKSFTFEDKALAEFDEINEELYDNSYKAQFVSGQIMPLMGFISNLGYVAIAVLGGYFVYAGTITLGAIQAFFQYSRKLNQPISGMAEVIGALQSAISAADRIFRVLDAEEEVEADDPVALEHAKGDVTFKDVYFGYEPGQTVISDFNLHVEPGETVAIVGPTGAGKTTLINLLLRFYELDSGSISIDGIDIRNLTRDELRSHFGMVLQDTWLFTGSVYDNIAYGKDDATAEEIEEAAKATYADNFIRTLPNGYDTKITESGSEISQGQRQLLTIARALISNPDILILDEATSSVDTRTEKLIQKAMDRLMRGRTNFVIAHRLSTIVGADTILVLQDGNIVEQGDHASLMALEGEYYKLYHSQFEGKEI